jgi:hypothetical protein
MVWGGHRPAGPLRLSSNGKQVFSINKKNIFQYCKPCLCLRFQETVLTGVEQRQTTQLKVFIKSINRSNKFVN